jgi:threonine dehydratase
MVGKDMKAPTVHSVRDARQRIATTAVATPLRMSAALSQRLAGSAFLKIESMQHTGSFKLRGAANAFLSLDMQAQRRGVVTYSTGNHGKAVAFVARTHGAQALVCVSDLVPENKRVALVAAGATLLVGGKDTDAAMEHAQAISARDGLALIDPFDNPDVIAGQGTIGLEILDVLPAVETIVVPLSGGGLLAGVAVAVKALKPSVRLVGVSSEHCPAMLRSIEAGRPVAVEERESLADSLGGGIGFSNRYTFEIVRCFVDEHVTVGEEAILEGMRAAFRDEGLVLEGAGAATIAACLAARPDNWRTPLVAVATGDNVDRALFARLVLAGLQ